MILSSLGTVIATRELALGRRKKVIVRIGKARKFRGSPDCYCPVQISGLGDDRIISVGGIDAIQAFELALLHIGASLYYSDAAKAGKLSWDAGQAPGDLGFPLLEGSETLLPKKVREVYVRKSFPVPPRPRAKRRRTAKRG